jgi:predicted DNA-binding antitoxin AbrB/MazE fold protein
MSKVIEAVYEHGVFRPLEPILLPEGEHVQVTVPDLDVIRQQRLAALDAFEVACTELTEEQWRLFDEAVQRRPWFGNRSIDL